jgi:hypothetical protein
LESEAEFCEDLLVDSLSFDTKFFFLPVLKSVSYQPPPFSLKEGAEINLARDSSPHFGHYVFGLSLNF